MESKELPYTDKTYLPALSPDLIVEARSAERLLIRGISPALARLSGIDPAEARGLNIERVFAGAVPSLSELVREVLARDEPLSGIQVRFPGEMTLTAEIAPGGLTEDFRGRMVVLSFREKTAPAVSFRGMRGTSPAIREVFRKIGCYAPSDASVVITGETGTGKELAARALHQGSPRAHGPFVAVNCSAISSELLESELFGHEKGAFTGAVRTHRGRFERADGGTLFLDEIGEMPLHTQAKLLRVLEEKRIERVGGEQEREIDVRVICATNLSLEQAVGQGRFRADLYHRLSVLRIHLPPLRERTEDLPLLVEHFLDTFNRKYGRRIERLTPEALALLRSYLWPGNIRELRNVLERVYIETRAEVIGARAFSEWIRERRDFSPGEWGPQNPAPRLSPALTPPWPLPSERRLLTSAQPFIEADLLPEKEARRSTRPADLDEGEILNAYRAAGGNLAAAARLLGVHRATLYRYLDRLGLKREDLERD
jgi:transcriptional regulator with GAF, ATPase, and Fis domain